MHASYAIIIPTFHTLHRFDRALLRTGSGTDQHRRTTPWNGAEVPLPVTAGGASAAPATHSRAATALEAPPAWLDSAAAATRWMSSW